MEEGPAGKQTMSNTFIESPKKTVNTATNQSQWSFGWQANSKPAYNKPNDSKGTFRSTQDSNFTTTRAASSSASKKAASKKNSRSKT